MYKYKRILALIPARGGSKGLPGKNIKPLLGKPLIAWTIEQARACNYIDQVVVSTDDEKIASISKEYGAELPFLRPDELAGDKAASIDVVLHGLEFFESRGQQFDILVLLEPTSPLREPADIQAAIEQLVNHPEAESIVGVCQVESAHPDFLVRLNNTSQGNPSQENPFLSPYTDRDFTVKRRQEIEKLYFFEGSLYISYSQSLKKRKNFYHTRTLGYMVPKWKSFEIDDLCDFIIVEALMQARDRLS